MGCSEGKCGKKNTQFKMDSVKILTEQEFSAVTTDFWIRCCNKVKSIEEKYLENEHFVDVITEDLIIHLGDDSDSSDTETDEYSDSN